MSLLRQVEGERDRAERLVVALERQLAEYQRSEASMGDAYATCVTERDRTQGKLDAIQRAVDAASDSGQYSLALVEIAGVLDLERILEGE